VAQGCREADGHVQGQGRSTVTQAFGMAMVERVLGEHREAPRAQERRTAAGAHDLPTEPGQGGQEATAQRHLPQLHTGARSSGAHARDLIGISRQPGIALRRTVE